MNFIEEEGKTFEEAVQKALDSLSVSRERVNIEILENGENKGFFNLKKKVRIRASIKESINEEERKQKIEMLLNKFLNQMNVDHSIKSVRESQEKIFVDFNSKDEGLIIGKWGRTINSVQHLMNLIYNREQLEKKRIILDVGKYRKKREDMLKNMALRYAEKALESNSEIILENLSPEDRKVVHMTLDKNTDIRTFSKGQGEYRTVVITPIQSFKNINE